MKKLLFLLSLVAVSSRCQNKKTIIKSVKICDQVWMSENLNVSKYRNGDAILQVTDPTAWSNLTTGAWCYYNNDPAYGANFYGKLYNWFAVNDPRGLAPSGWHVPSHDEWTTLATCLGNNPGGQIKEAGTSHWLTPNTGATNSSGFTGLPAGGRSNSNGAFFGIGENANWWTSTGLSVTHARTRFVVYNNTFLAFPGQDFKSAGYSVRCIRD